MKRFFQITIVLVTLLVMFAYPAVAAEIGVSLETEPIGFISYSVRDPVDYNLSIVNPSDVFSCSLNIEMRYPDGSIALEKAQLVLAPSESKTYSSRDMNGVYKVNEEDINEDNKITSEVWVDGVAFLDDEGVSISCGDIEVYLTKASEIIVEEEELDLEIIKDGPATAKPGDTITYSFSIRNTGNIALERIDVSDSVYGDVTTLFPEILAPKSEPTIINLDVKLTEELLDQHLVNGMLTNTVTATYKCEDTDEQVIASDSHDVEVESDTNLPAVCNGLTRGYWSNWDNHYSLTEFEMLASDTIVAGDVYEAEEIFSRGNGKAINKLKAQLLAAQLTLSLTDRPDLPNPDGAYLTSNCTIELEEGTFTVGEMVNKALEILEDPTCFAKDYILEVKDILDEFNNL